MSWFGLSKVLGLCELWKVGKIGSEWEAPPKRNSWDRHWLSWLLNNNVVIQKCPSVLGKYKLLWRFTMWAHQWSRCSAWAVESLDYIFSWGQSTFHFQPVVSILFFVLANDSIPFYSTLIIIGICSEKHAYPSWRPFEKLALLGRLILSLTCRLTSRISSMALPPRPGGATWMLLNDRIK